MIKLDESNVGNQQDFTPIKAGEYEVFPTAFEVTTSQNGNPMVQFNYVIRDDVQQEFGGRQIRYDRFTITPAAMWRLNQASKAAGLDMSQEYADATAWANAFKNKAVRVYVANETRNEKTYPVVKSFKESTVGGSRQVDEQPQISISDEELPF